MINKYLDILRKIRFDYELKIRIKNYAKRAAIQRLGIISDQIFFTNSHMMCNIRNNVVRNDLYSGKTSVSYYAPSLNENLINNYPSRYFYSAEFATIEPVSGMIYDKDGIFIAETSAWNPFRLFYSFPQPFFKNPRKKLSGQYIYMPSIGFYHWLIEDLGPFLAVLDKYPKAKILAPSNLAKYVSDILDELKCELVYIDKPVQVEMLHFVGKTAGQGSPVFGLTCHPQDITLINNHFENKFSVKNFASGADKFYLSRRGATRAPSNEADLISELKANGYIEFHADLKLNLYEQYAMLSSAEKIVGIHGASMSHIAWIKGRSKVMELHSDYIPACYSMLSSIKCAEYNCFKYGKKSDDKIKIDKFLETMSDKKFI